MSPMGKCLMGICRHGYMSHGYMSPNPLHHVEVDFSCFQARNLEHHVEVVITEFAERDVDQLPVRVQVVHDCFRFSNLGSFLLFENYIEN